MPFSEALLSRIEDAGLNASASPRQRWLDGWLLRTQPGKARRSRCINALAAGHLGINEKLGLAQRWFDECHVPLLMRITAFTQPRSLDDALATRGWDKLDVTQVLVLAQLPQLPQLPPGKPDALVPGGLTWQALSGDDYAAAVGRLRSTPSDQQEAHAERLRQSPVPYKGFALQDAGGHVLACGQFAREDRMVGLYDVHTHPSARNRGLSGWLCKRLLTLAAFDGADLAYLQVEAENYAAQAVYRRLGFVDGYSYHYRQPPEAV